MSVDLKRIVEALLFVAESPLSPAQLAASLGMGEKEALNEALVELRQEYQSLGRSFELVEVAGGWAFRTRPELAHWLREARKEQATRLSRAALETLAIVAYKQPVLKADIERMRGVEVGSVLRMLMEKELVRVAGRRDLPGRPLIYGTTRRFLEVFDLKDLSDLPTLEEMEALAGPTDTLPLGRYEQENSEGEDREPGEPVEDVLDNPPEELSPTEEPTDDGQAPDQAPEALEAREGDPASDREPTAQPEEAEPRPADLEEAVEPEEALPEQPWSEDADCDPLPEEDPLKEGTTAPSFPPGQERDE